MKKITIVDFAGGNLNALGDPATGNVTTDWTENIN